MTDTVIVTVIPAQAGIQAHTTHTTQWDNTQTWRSPLRGAYMANWLPACAGMTRWSVTPAAARVKSVVFNYGKLNSINNQKIQTRTSPCLPCPN